MQKESYTPTRLSQILTLWQCYTHLFTESRPDLGLCRNIGALNIPRESCCKTVPDVNCHVEASRVSFLKVETLHPVSRSRSLSYYILASIRLHLREAMPWSRSSRISKSINKHVSTVDIYWDKEAEANYCNHLQLCARWNGMGHASTINKEAINQPIYFLLNNRCQWESGTP